MSFHSDNFNGISRGLYDIHDIHDDIACQDHSGCGGWPQTAPRNSNIVRIEIPETIAIVSPLVRGFRESGRFTELAYSILLNKMRREVGIPEYKPNLPIFLYSPGIEEKKYRKALYVCRKQYKHLMISSLHNLRGFLGVWYLYLSDRNYGFRRDKEDFPAKGKTFPERRYSDDLLEASEPLRVRRLKERAHIEILEI